jgi:hypothetical protein
VALTKVAQMDGKFTEGLVSNLRKIKSNVDKKKIKNKRKEKGDEFFKISALIQRFIIYLSLFFF